jgi:hypothetical protein
MITHSFYITEENKIFNQEFNDDVYTFLVFFYVSKKQVNDTEQTVETRYQLTLQNPDLNDFTPSSQVDLQMKTQWVQDSLSVIEHQLQEINLELL